MNNFPYIRPDSDLYYNLGLLLLIFYELEVTPRGKKVLNLDRIQSFYFLTTKPVFLNKVLELAKKSTISVESSDYYNVNALSVNVDELFDRSRILLMVKVLASKNYLTSDYSKAEGFVFFLTDLGKKVASDLTEGYFYKINSFIKKLSALQSMTPANLNGYINMVLKGE